MQLREELQLSHIVFEHNLGRGIPYELQLKSLPPADGPGCAAPALTGRAAVMTDMREGEPERPNGGADDAAPRAVPRWARPAGGRTARTAGWRSRLRPRRLIWPAAALLLLFAVWSNYPFVPNLWTLLFRQPSGAASAVSAPGQWAMYGGGPRLANIFPPPRRRRG